MKNIIQPTELFNLQGQIGRFKCQHTLIRIEQGRNKGKFFLWTIFDRPIGSTGEIPPNYKIQLNPTDVEMWLEAL